MRVVGATFQLGRRSTPPTSASNTVASVDTGVEATNRPHIDTKCKTAHVRIDLLVNQSLAPATEVLDCAERAEAMGFDSFFVFDHLATMQPDVSPGEMLDPHVLLGALALRTSRMNLGVLVNNVSLRRAEVIAGATASLDIVSNGRAVLGLGAGAAPKTYFAAEFDALDIPIPTPMERRHEVLLESLDKIRAVWRGEHDRGVRLPKPLSEVPTVIGLNSTTLAAKAAARGCGINVRANHPDLEAIVGNADPSLGEWAASVWLHYNPDLFHPDHPMFRSYAELGITRVMLMTTERDDLVTL